jgi:hypothetical protein
MLFNIPETPFPLPYKLIGVSKFFVFFGRKLSYFIHSMYSPDTSKMRPIFNQKETIFYSKFPSYRGEIVTILDHTTVFLNLEFRQFVTLWA